MSSIKGSYIVLYVAIREFFIPSLNLKESLRSTRGICPHCRGQRTITYLREQSLLWIISTTCSRCGEYREFSSDAVQ